MVGNDLLKTTVARRALMRHSAVAALLASATVSACTKTAADLRGPDRDLLNDVAGLLMPSTDTAGADSMLVNAADVALNAIYVGQDQTDMGMVGSLRHALDAAAGGDYLRAPVETRVRALESTDARAFATKQPDQTDMAWRKLKGLLLLGYYTSEIGASQELRYELVPGRYDPDLPLTTDTRAISSDWFAVSFR